MTASAQLSDSMEEQEAVLAAMLEGVLAVDREGQVIMMNSAAARCLMLTAHGQKAAPSRRRFAVPTSIVSSHFTLRAGQPVEREIIRYEHQEQILQLRGTPILERRYK